MDNIVLIGMPGCGKTTAGVALANALNMEFIDSDKVIIDDMHMTLAEIIGKYGTDGFREVENRVNSSIECRGTVIATGGSVIYGREAMEHLRKIGIVVYLKLPYEEIETRLGDLSARGVSMKPGQTLRDLYAERCPLYEKYAHRVLDCSGFRLRQVVLELIKIAEESTRSNHGSDI